MGWNLNDELYLIEAEQYDENCEFSHKTITVERVKDNTLDMDEVSLTTMRRMKNEEKQ